MHRKDGGHAILDHLINDLGLDKIAIEDSSDHYRNCPASEIHDMSKKPVGARCWESR